MPLAGWHLHSWVQFNAALAPDQGFLESLSKDTHSKKGSCSDNSHPHNRPISPPSPENSLCSFPRQKLIISPGGFDSQDLWWKKCFLTEQSNPTLKSELPWICSRVDVLTYTYGARTWTAEGTANGTFHLAAAEWLQTVTMSGRPFWLILSPPPANH